MQIKNHSVIGAFLLILGAIQATHVKADGCPPGSVEVRREQMGDGHWKIYCQEISKLTPIQIATLDPAAIERLSPADRAALDARKPYCDALQQIRPLVYVTPDWAAYARPQQRVLIVGRA